MSILGTLPLILSLAAAPQADPEDIEHSGDLEPALPYDAGPAPQPDEESDEGEAPSGESQALLERSVPARPHFVFINTYGMTLGISYAPSWDTSLFFGAALRRGETPRRWALGYQLTGSLGLADRYYDSIKTVRHHLAAYSYSSSGRLLASASLGVAFFQGYQPAILEGEGRIGYMFGRRRLERRLVGIVGGMLRLGWTFLTVEEVPMPQFGVFLGFAVR